MLKKTLTILMCCVAAIALLPSGYSIWSDHVEVRGTIETGEWIEKYLVYLDGRHDGTYLSQGEAVSAVSVAIDRGSQEGHVIEKLSGTTVYQETKPVVVASPVGIPSAVPATLPPVDMITPAPTPAINMQPQPISEGVRFIPTDPGLPSPPPAPLVGEAAPPVPIESLVPAALPIVEHPPQTEQKNSDSTVPARAVEVPPSTIEQKGDPTPTKPTAEAPSDASGSSSSPASTEEPPMFDTVVPTIPMESLALEALPAVEPTPQAAPTNSESSAPSLAREMQHSTSGQKSGLTPTVPSAEPSEDQTSSVMTPNIQPSSPGAQPTVVDNAISSDTTVPGP